MRIAGATAPNSVVCNWTQRRRVGCSSTAKLLLDGGPISGARPIHSLTGPAKAVSGEAQRADSEQDDEQGGDPRRDAAAVGGLDHRRKRQGDDGGGEDRQQDGAAEIEDSAEQKQENAEVAARPAEDHMASDAADRLRVVHDDDAERFTVRCEYIPLTWLPHPAPYAA